MPPCHDSRVGSKLRSLKIFNRAQRHQVAWRCCVLPLCERWLTTRILLLKEEAQDNSGVASNYCLMCLRLRSRVCADAPACSCVCVCSCGLGPRVDRSNVQRWRANLQKSVKECARICKRVQTSARESAKECKRVLASVTDCTIPQERKIMQNSVRECNRSHKNGTECAKECKGACRARIWDSEIRGEGGNRRSEDLKTCPMLGRGWPGPDVLVADIR